MLEPCFPPPTERYREARRIAAEELAPAVNGSADGDAAGFSRELWRGLGRCGFFRLPFPAELGGPGLGCEEVLDFLEGLGAGLPAFGPLFGAGAHLWAVARPVADFGSDEQKARWLPPLLDGSLVGAHAATEAGAGSDVMSLATRYRAEGGGFVLDGAKRWVTNAPAADLFVIFATSDPRLHFRGISAFLVPRETPGLAVGPPEPLMGLEGAPLASLTLQNCFVPQGALLGRERRGNQIFQTSLAWERALIQAPQVGAVRRQIERAVEHARERRQFGQPIASYQAVSHRIVGMLAQYWQMRLVLRAAAQALFERGDSTLAPLAKLVLSEGALAAHLDGLRVLGGAGYSRRPGADGAVAERDVRDAVAGTIASGTSDIQKNLLASALGL